MRSLRLEGWDKVLKAMAEVEEIQPYAIAESEVRAWIDSQVRTDGPTLAKAVESIKDCGPYFMAKIMGVGLNRWFLLQSGEVVFGRSNYRRAVKKARELGFNLRGEEVFGPKAKCKLV